MSSRKPEETPRETGKAKHLRFYSRWSLAKRLMLLYIASLFCILAITLFLLFHDVTQNLQSQDYRFLVNKIEVARAILKNAGDPRDRLEEEVVLESDAMQFAKYYSRIADDRGHTVIQSINFSHILKESAFPGPVGVKGKPIRGVRWQAANGKWYLLVSALATDNRDGRNPYLIQIALDISYERALIDDYKRVMLLVLIAGFLLASILGVIITRKGLQPLNEITGAIGNISSNRLHERIGSRPWPGELVVLAESFDGMLTRLEDSFRRLRQFSADLAHELRTPIHNLMGETEVALNKNRTAEEYRRVLESNMEEYERLVSMIESLLFLARADKTEISINKKKLNARESLESIVDFYKPLFDEHQITVNVEGEGWVCADPVLYRRVINNVVSNAVKFTPDDGTIHLIIHTLSDHTEIEINDSGCGIAGDDLTHIFDRFYRADRSRTGSKDGAGLGLSIVKAIMELHKGEVTIKSQPGKGTHVMLRFPEDEERS
jgi:two-component system heavy metal sensor histidine kinase CusS